MALDIDPPLINSANPWATTIEDLRNLYNSPYTGAVTIRTSLLKPFAHDPKIHQYTFFNASAPPGSKTAVVGSNGRSEVLPGQDSSLNTLGYSPISLPEYVRDMTRAMEDDQGPNKDFVPRPSKPIIFSVTGTAEDVCRCYQIINAMNNEERTRKHFRCLMEINLSCPNIPSKPPPAYSSTALDEYLLALSIEKQKPNPSFPSPTTPLLIGIKTPPYTYQGQYDQLLTSLRKSTSYPTGCPISFITSTNTLGSCLVLSSNPPVTSNPSVTSNTPRTKTYTPALSSANSTGIGGLAGAALHPISLGNVATIRQMLDESESEEVRKIEIIGVGGVSDSEGFKRMKGVGASVVGVGTALGRDGVGVFGTIWEGLGVEEGS